MKHFFTALVIILAHCVHAQRNEYGQIRLADLNAKSYNLDTTANAIYLMEFGDAYF
jgi:hypothetical protein